MLLWTCPRYRSDSKERAINMPGQPEQTSVSMKPLSALGGLQKVLYGWDVKRHRVKEQAEELRTVLHSENDLKTLNHV